MSRSLGSLTLDLVAQVGGFEQGFDRAARTAQTKSQEIERQSKESAGKVEAAWSTAAKSIGGAFGALSAGALFTKFIQETTSAQDEQAQLAAVLKSTGQAAGYNADQLNKMADAISKSSRFSAGEINVAQTALLAFTGIAGDQFPKALQAAADMAARTGTSIASAAEKIGRALDVPSKGLSALSEQGFRFDDSQKKLVTSLENTGRVAEAQAVILDALTSTYGGAAEAARNNLGGALAALRNNLSDLFTGDDGAAESLRQTLEGVNSVLESDGFKTGLAAAAEGIRLLAPGAAAFVAVKLSTSLFDTAKAAVSARAETLASAVATRNATAASVDFARAKLAEAQATVAATAGFGRLAVVQQTLIPAQRALAAATDAHAVSMRSASVAGLALTAIGGPLGLVTLALTAGVTAWSLWGRGADDAKQSALNMKDPIDKLVESFGNLSTSQQRVELNRITKDLAEAGKEAESTLKSIASFADLEVGFTDLAMSQQAVNGLRELQAEINRMRSSPEAFDNLGASVDAAVQKFIAAAGITGDVRIKLEEMAAKAVDAANSQKTLTEQSGALASALGGVANAGQAANAVLAAQSKSVADFQDKYASKAERRLKEVDEWSKRLGRALSSDELSRINKAFADTSSTRSAASTDTSAAQRIAATQSQIAEQELLSKALATYGLEASKVNAGDKLMLQIQQQLSLAVKDRTGKLTNAMLGEDMARARVLSGLIRENEEKQRSLKLSEDIENYTRGLQAGQTELGQSLQVLAANWGKTAEEQQIATAQAKIYRDAEKQIDAVLKAGLPGALKNVAQIEETAEAHAQVTAMLMGRIQAEQGAQQLLTENRRFAAESILDEDQRASAIVQIDTDMWRERIRIAGAGTAEQQKLQEQFDIWLKNQAMRPMLEAQRAARQQIIDDWVETIDGVGEVFREGFADMLNGGVDSWDAFTKSLATTFKTTVADAIYKAFLKPIIVNLAANAAGLITGDNSIASAVSKAGGGSGNVLSLASSASKIGDSIFGGSGSVFGALGQSSLFSGTSFGAGLQVAGSTGLMGGLSTAGSLLGAGQFGAAAGAALPGIGAALAAYSVLSSVFGSKGEKRAGGTFGLVDGSAQFLHGPSGGTAGQSAVVGKAIDETVGSINSMLAAVGSAASVAGYRAAFEQSDKNRGGVMSGGTLSTGGAFGESGTGSNYAGTYYERSSTQSPDVQTAVANLVTDLKQSTIQALQAAVDIPQSLRALIDGVDAESLSDEAVTGLLETINAQIAAVGQFREAVALMPFEQLEGLSYDAAQALISLSGGVDSLISGLSTYYENFYTEAERMQTQLESISDAARDVGITLPGTKEEFRALVESLDLTTEGGQKAYATLIGLSGSFAQWVDYVESIPAAVVEAVATGIDPERIRQIVEAAVTAAQEAVQSAQSGANDAMTILSNAIQLRRDEIQTAFDLVSKSLQTGIDAAQASVTKLSALSARLKSTLDGLAQQFDPAQNRRNAQDRISQALSVAQLTGMLPDASALENALSVIAQPSEGLFATFEDYQTDFLRTANDIAALNKLTEGQLTTEEKTLATLQQSLRDAQAQYDEQMRVLNEQLSTGQRQLEEAMGTRLAVMSVEDAITNLSASIAALAAAQQNVPKPVGGGGGGILDSLSPAEQAVYDAYKGSGLSYLDTEGFKFWTDAIANGANVADIVGQIKGINEAKNALIDGSHATGLDSVPWDGYIAELHAGEMVLPADDARAYRTLQNAPGMGSVRMEVAAEMRALREELAGLRAETRGVLRETKRSADMLDQATGGGGPVQVEMA